MQISVKLALESSNISIQRSVQYTVLGVLPESPLNYECKNDIDVELSKYEYKWKVINKKCTFNTKSFLKL